MSAFYTNASNTARSLLLKFGQAVTLTGTSSSGEYDPATGEAITPTTSSVTGVGAVFPFSDQTRQTNVNADSSLILSGDVQLTLYTTDVPEIGMITVLNGSTWRVESIDTLAPAGEVVYYVLRLRK